MANVTKLILGFTIVLAGTWSEAFALTMDDTTDPTNSATIFADRILPIFRSADPSSCVQCHLSSVDLKNYILPSHEKTFASLRDQGLIDLNDPEKSKILKLIKMGDQDANAGAKMIHAKMRKAEYEAFADWIKASCNDKQLIDLPPIEESERAKPASPTQVIRHARKSRVVDSFVRNVWSQRMRCFPCHTPHEIGPNQKNAKKKFEQWQELYGDQMLIFKKTPEATLDFLIKESGNAKLEHLPLLNLKEPTKSLLVVKPTSKVPPKNEAGERVPTYSEPIYHMGGLKMHTDDHSYKSFVAWIKDYASVAGGRYAEVAELPIDNWHPTRMVLRLRDIPETWTVGMPVQMFVYAQTDSHATGRNGWSKNPIAFTQATVTPRRMANGSLILLAPTDSQEVQRWRAQHVKIPEGKLRVKIFTDSKERIADDPTILLGEDDYQGEVTLNKDGWKPGFKNAAWVSAGDLTSKE